MGTSLLAPPTELLSSGAAWFVFVAAYLLGALPFGWIFVRMIRGVDIRTLGSGNIGATNTIRAIGKPLGLLVFALDFGKGWLPASFLAPLAVSGEGQLALQVACGGAAVLGHCFPVYLTFRGGKGVATASGALLAIDPTIFLLGGALWLVTIALTRYASLASMMMGVAFATLAWFRSDSESRELFYGALLLALLILVRHRSNLRRMMRGDEPKVGLRSAEENRG